MSEEIFQTEIQDFYGRRAKFSDLTRRVRRAIVEEAKPEMYDILVTGANNVRDRIIKGMRDSPKSGRLYFLRYGKSGRPIYHRASSRGNYPRPDTGGLVGSIQMDEGVDQVEVGSMITKPNYPLFLEKGTARMAARPWLERSFRPEESDVKRRLMGALRSAAGRLGRP